MQIEKLDIPEVLLIKPKVFGDHRGFFLESWNQRLYADSQLDLNFVQDNVSRSAQGVLRGLHYQWPKPQGKLVSAIFGSVFDVAVDIRLGSPTFGQWVGALLTDQNHHRLWVPPGFAHGFQVISPEGAIFSYKCTEYYSPADEHSLLWNDPDINVAWHPGEPALSGKDAAALCLSQIPPQHLPLYKS